MNHYGAMAQQHWSRWLPTRYAAIPDPETFFAELGEQAALQIAALGDELAGADPQGETYLAKLGRLNATRNQAQELVLAELILLPPEPGADPDEEPTGSEPGPGWIPAVEDPSHPYWATRQP